jgi:hypothetical protein
MLLGWLGRSVCFERSVYQDFAAILEVLYCWHSVVGGTVFVIYCELFYAGLLTWRGADT